MEQTTRKQILEIIKQCEKKGEFDKHIDPIDWDNALPVDKNFKYIKTRFREKIKPFFQNLFIVKPFTYKVAKFDFHTKVFGRENLKGIKSAILTLNHINKFDCLLAKYGLRKNKLRITGGDFNNQKGWFGEMMRVGGLMPFSSNFSAMSNFNRAMETLLANNYYVLFYPEQAMWWNYEKPRPYKNGAFHYAVKHNVPIIPMFITLKNSGKFDKEGLPKKNYALHIMPAIYADKNLDKKQNIEFLKNKTFESCKNKYEEVYKKPLTYSCDEK